MSFANLKRNKNKLKEKILKNSENQASGGDDRFWKPSVDSAGNGFAIIRFLPPSDGEELPWVKLWSHFFQGPGGYYIENSLTTIGKDDPVGEYNQMLWNSGSDAGKEQARKQKRRLDYIANIYVVEDKANPENDGKVFLYRFGKKIFDKLNEAMHPEFEDETPINPFDFWEGANFKLKIRNVEGYRNYDKSEFDASGALFDDDDKLEEIYKQEYPLQPFVADDQFKPYEELKARLTRVLGEIPAVVPDETATLSDDEPQTEMPSVEETSIPSADSDGDDEDLEFFKNLASDD